MNNSKLSCDYHFSVAEFPVTISFAPSQENGMQLVPSLMPFAQAEGSSAPLFHITVDDSLRPLDPAACERIRTIDTGNGDTVVDEIVAGGYQFLIRNVSGHDCCLLITNKDFSRCRCALYGNHSARAFGLNNALMLAFAFASCRMDTVLIHASLVRYKGLGYAFIAQSGTGKSTHVSLWLKHIADCDLMNDDNPIVRVIDNRAYIYGSPWSGKTPCYRNVKAPLGAITQIDRAKENSVERYRPFEAFTQLLTAVSAMKWDNEIYGRICDTIARIVECTPVYVLHCRPDREAALVCHRAICQQEETNK